jgi:hypothetical protein
MALLGHEATVPGALGSTGRPRVLPRGSSRAGRWSRGAERRTEERQSPVEPIDEVIAALDLVLDAIEDTDADAKESAIAAVTRASTTARGAVVPPGVGELRAARTQRAVGDLNDLRELARGAPGMSRG